MALTQQIIDQAAERYWRESDRYAKLAEYVGEACRRLLKDNVIRGSVQWRAKDAGRLKGKLEKQMAKGDHAEEYTDVDSVFEVIKDFAGVRVLTYVEGDRGKVVELIRGRFAGTAADGSVDPVKKDGENGFYRATHCTVMLRADDLGVGYENLKGLACEVQVCSLLAHVYNEIEHDLRYKTLSGDLSQKENEILNALAKQMEIGDTNINHVLDAARERQESNQAEFEDQYDFVARMRKDFPEASNFAANAGQLFELCDRLGLNSPEKIRDAVCWDDKSAAQGSQRVQELATRINANEDIQLQVDPESSDQLLVLLLTPERVKRIRELYPSGRGIGRAPRFLSVAKHLNQQPSQP